MSRKGSRDMSYQSSSAPPAHRIVLTHNTHILRWYNIEKKTY